MPSKISYTDLFNDYFNNPAAQYVNATISPCSGASSASDIAFDFTNKGGAISNNKSILSQFDLSDIHIPVKQWTTNYKILAPKSIEYLQGIDLGSSYETMYYCIPEEISVARNYSYFTNIQFTINYTQNFRPNSVTIDSSTDFNKRIDFINDVNNQLMELEIPLELSIEDNNSYIKFMSTSLGFNYKIDDTVLMTTIDVSTNPYSPFEYSDFYNLIEDCEKYVDYIKYPNGAFRGILLKVTYPKYKADSILNYEKSLKINHIKDKISVYQPICDCSTNTAVCDSACNQLYEKLDFNVIGSYFNPEEINNNGWIEGGVYFSNSVMNYSSSNQNSLSSNDGWIQPSGANAWNPARADYENQLGLYGYLNWVESNNMWTNIGSFYSIITSDDSPDNNIKNFTNSLIIFNPNDFPVKIDYLMFI